MPTGITYKEGLYVRSAVCYITLSNRQLPWFQAATGNLLLILLQPVTIEFTFTFAFDASLKERVRVCECVEERE